MTQPVMGCICGVQSNGGLCSSFPACLDSVPPCDDLSICSYLNLQELFGLVPQDLEPPPSPSPSPEPVSLPAPAQPNRLVVVATPETILVGRSGRRLCLSSYIYILRGLSEILVKCPGSHLFVVSGKNNIMNRLNAHVGKKCKSGVVAGILRDCYGIVVKQENICPTCSRVCTIANCGRHYFSAAKNRNRLMVASGVAFAS